MRKTKLFISLAVFCLAAFTATAQRNAVSKQTVAVYVTGEGSNNHQKVVGAKMVSTITQEKRFAAVERTEEFISELNREHDYQQSGAVSDSQIAQLGEKFGAEFVVVVDISELYGSVFLAARMIEVQTQLITATAEGDRKINRMSDLTALADDVAKALFGQRNPRTTKREVHRRLISPLGIW